jgi:N-acetylglutamate synthase-like GNAT family acetyltransferase
MRKLITIRHAKQSDAVSVQELLCQLGYPDFTLQEVQEKIASHDKAHYRVLVAEVEDRVVGVASLHWFEMLHRKGLLGRITAFCVHEDFRSRGIGQELLKACEVVLRDAGCERLEVTSNLKRAKAHQFYLKSGYLEDSLRFIKN